MTEYFINNTIGSFLFAAADGAEVDLILEGRIWTGILLAIVCGAVLFFINAARSGRDLKIRKIAGLEAVTEAVGRATEMGKKCLFVNPTFTSHIVGIPRAESDAILGFLYEHSVAPERLCRYRWSEGDVGFWDNRCTMHYAIFDYGKARRRIHRVTIEGDRPVA